MTSDWPTALTTAYSHILHSCLFNFYDCSFKRSSPACHANWRILSGTCSREQLVEYRDCSHKRRKPISFKLIRSGELNVDRNACKISYNLLPYHTRARRRTHICSLSTADNMVWTRVHAEFTRHLLSAITYVSSARAFPAFINLLKKIITLYEMNEFPPYLTLNDRLKRCSIYVSQHESFYSICFSLMHVLNVSANALIVNEVTIRGQHIIVFIR